VAFTGEAAGGLDAELARVRVDRGCVGAGCAGAAAEGTPVAIGALGSAARLLVSASGKAGAKTGSVSSVLAEAVDAPEVAATEADRGEVVTVPVTVIASGAAVACMDEPDRAAWVRRRREMRLGVGSSKTLLGAWGSR